MQFELGGAQVEVDKRSVAILSAIALIGALYLTGGSVARGAGRIAPNEPIQVMLAEGKARPFTKGEYQINPVANYSFEARVLSTESYWFDGGADLSPVDLAIGWGAMSDTSLLDQLSFSHGRRFFNYRYPASYTGSPAEIINHISNVHIVPASDAIESQIKRLRKGELVRVKGQLVVATKGNGWRWQTSLTRDDSGAGACELMYVEKVEVI